MIQEARASKGNQTVVWLDLAHAYGSIPHSLIYAALDHYHIPQHIKGMITSYFGTYSSVYNSVAKPGKGNCKWMHNLPHPLCHGNKSPDNSCWGRSLKTSNGIKQSSMDDLTVTTKTHVEARWELTALDRMTTWSRMKFKSKKSRSMVIQNGKLTGSPCMCKGMRFHQSRKNK